MRSTVSTAVADIVKSWDSEVELRIVAQEEALDENKCFDIVSAWVDANDVEYLYAVLDLPDIEFAKRFPSVAAVTYDRRQEMKAAIQSHLVHCRHCSLKHGFELDLDSRIMRACREHRGDLLQLLENEDMDLTEGDHPIFEPFINDLPHQPDIHRESEIIIDPPVEPIVEPA